LFKNMQGYQITGFTADATAVSPSGSLLSALDGVSALGAGKNITLDTSAGIVTQAASKNLTATGLALRGDAAYTLTNTANTIAQLAASAGAGVIRYVDADGLAVGTVNGTPGITRSGDVSLRNETGDITLAQSLSLGAQALRLQSQTGAVTQTGGTISAANLGVQAQGNIALGSANTVSTGFAANSTAGDVLFKNMQGYQITGFTADAT
ncbi:hypothetical protein ACVBEH_24710, partial [Roseateles sp. GG27B]